MSLQKKLRREKIKKKVRRTVSGTVDCPRFSVFRSNLNIYVQIIDDESGKTLVAASSRQITAKKKTTKIEQAQHVGKEVAERAVKAGISKVVFDRNGYLYHGRVKALADSAREQGLKF